MRRTTYLILAISIAGLFISGKLYSRDILPSKTIDVKATQAESAPWTIFSKLNEKDDELASMSLNVWKQDKVFYEKRVSLSNGNVSVTQKKITDQEREIGLKLLNTETGEIRVIKVSTDITPSGVNITAPDGYQIETVERPSGIRWNKWATEYQIDQPNGWVVLKDNYPSLEHRTVTKIVKNKNGIKRKVSVQEEFTENYIYSPFSQGLKKPEIIEAGISHDKTLVKNALAKLRESRVKSRAFPNKLVADVEYLKPEYFERLPILEHTDLFEFFRDCPNDYDQTGTDCDKSATESIDRFFVEMGLNGPGTKSKTGSKANALGLLQLTNLRGNGTYATIRRTYPAAGLINDFESGAKDQLNSMTAAILLDDYNLAGFIKNNGAKILNDPDSLEELLDSGYNGSPKRASKSLSASILNKIEDWINSLSAKKGGLKPETKGYIAKLRYLQENNLP